VDPLKKNSVYQYCEVPANPLSKKKWNMNPVPVYVVLQSVKEGVAKCKVVLIKKQPSKKRFFVNSWVYVPSGQLTEPDIFPKFSRKPIKWKSLAEENSVIACLSVLRDVHPNLHNRVLESVEASQDWSTIVAKPLNALDLKIGQIWKIPKTKEKITLSKKFGNSYVIKDKFGTMSKMGADELAKKLASENYELSNRFNVNAVLKAVGIVLAPYVGTVMLVGLLKLLESRLKR